MNCKQILLLSIAPLGCAVAAQSAFVGHTSARAAEPRQPAAATIYGKWCADCHTRESGSGTVALQRKYQGRVPAVLEQRSDLHPEYVKLVVRRGISFMPSFRKTEISDAELALLSAYLAPAQGRAR